MISPVNKIIFPKWFWPTLIIIIFCVSGYSNVTLSDIETAILQQNYSQAKDLSEKFLTVETYEEASLKATYYLALSHLRLRNYANALENFDQLIKKKPDKILLDRCYLGIIDAHYLKEDYLEAFEACERLMKISPGSDFLSLIYLKFAKINLKLAHWSEARGYLDKILNDFPTSFEATIAKQLKKEKQYFAVQVGSFSERQRAERLVFELKEKGEYAYIVETTDRQGRRFYRVRVGQLAFLNAARKLQAKLSKDGYPTKIYP